MYGLSWSKIKDNDKDNNDEGARDGSYVKVVWYSLIILMV